MQLQDMFPGRYLRGQDMSRPMLIEMRSVEKAQLRPGPNKPEETAYVLHFEDVSHGAPARVRGLVYTPGKGYSLVLRRRLAAEIMAATDTSDTDEWNGKRVVIYPEQMIVANRTVTAIRARRSKQSPAISASTAANASATPLADSPSTAHERSVAAHGDTADQADPTDQTDEVKEADR